MAMHQRDYAKITARAEEQGWEVVHTDPLTLTKLDRTVRIDTNMSGMINSVEWHGGDERKKLGSGSASVSRVLDWLGTDIDGPAPEAVEPGLPETEMQAQKPPPPVIPDELKESVGEVPAGVSMMPPAQVEADDAAEAATDPPPAKKAPAKKAPAKKATSPEARKDADPDPEASGAVPAESFSPGSPL